jgi:hypothetical protein
MKKILGAVLLMLWCGLAGATTAWTPSSMGAGGNFCAADINSNGVVLVGSDISGLYRRTSNSGDWTRVGYQDGLDCTHIFSLRFMDAEPNKVIAGTGRGFYYSSGAGASWSRVTSTNGPTNDVGAVCWANDGNNAGTCFGVFNNQNPAADDKVYFSVSSNYGQTWTKGAGLVEVVSQSFTSGNDPERQPIKIAADPSTSGNTREIYVLMGIIAGNNVAWAEEAAAYDSASKHFPPRYRDLYQSRDNGATWRQLVSGNVVDFAIDSTAAHHVAIALSNSNYVSSNRYGVIKTTTDASQSSVTWNTETVDNNHANKEPTGAIWCKSDLYLLTVEQDPCGGSANPTAGVWVKSGGSWSHVDDGQGGGSWSADTWESGWTVSGSSPCGLRYGQTIANSAQSVSPRGEYRVTGSFVWQYNWGAASGRGYKSSFTNSGSGPYTGKKIDNVNVAALYLDGTDLWAGYYDVGLWKLGGSGWENHNATGFGTWDGNGGNVNGITKQGSTMYVCAAASSKGDDWKVWSNTNSGSGYPAADWSQLSDSSALCSRAVRRGLERLTRLPVLDCGRGRGQALVGRDELDL